jgi:hypothetical protein
MYDYQVQPSVRTEEFPGVCTQMQTEGWSVEQIFQRERGAQGVSVPSREVVYDIVFKKASKDISYGQMLINRYSEKLTEVANNLRVTCSNSRPAIVIADGIDKFLFDGSPSDM